MNADDENSIGLDTFTNAKVLTFGIENNTANVIAKNIKFDNEGFASFDVYYDGNFFDSFALSISGMHNVLNALSCIALCHEYGIPNEAIKSAFISFTGANRRLEYKGICNGAQIFDDYAHHPTEIKATAAAINRKTFNESWVVFQPHTYSRLKNLLNDFAESLLDFDHIILTDVYAAREKNIFNISSQDLADKLESLGKHVTYIHEFDTIVEFLKKNAQSGDIILTLGAGTVTNIGPMLLE